MHKHAGASNVAVIVRAEDDSLLVEVRDDGRGGADEEGGGLRGLADRVEALLQERPEKEMSTAEVGEVVMEELKRAFRPEFLNRIDDTIVFHSLSREDITAIVRLMLARINAQLTEKGIHIDPTQAALELLVEKGFDATYGARQLRRTIQKHVEDPLAEAIVRGQVTDGSRLELDVEGDNFVFKEAQVPEPPLALAEH